MRTFVIARVGDSAGPEPSLVRDHRVVPCRQPDAQRNCFRSPNTRTQQCVWIHLRPILSHGNRRHTFQRTTYCPPGFLERGCPSVRPEVRSLAPFHGMFVRSRRVGAVRSVRLDTVALTAIGWTGGQAPHEGVEDSHITISRGRWRELPDSDYRARPSIEQCAIR